MKKMKVSEDIVIIWSNLSKIGRKRLLQKKLDEDELFKNSQSTMKKLMSKFKLQDTTLFENQQMTPSKNIPLNSKKTLKFLKDQFKNNAKEKLNKIRRSQKLNKFYREKHQRLRALKEGNRVRHHTTHNHQLNLVKQANLGSKKFFKEKKFFQDLMNKAQTNLELGDAEHLRNTGFQKLG